MIVDFDKYPIEWVTITQDRDYIDTPVSRTYVYNGLSNVVLEQPVELEMDGQKWVGVAKIDISILRRIYD